VFLVFAEQHATYLSFSGRGFPQGSTGGSVDSSMTPAEYSISSWICGVFHNANPAGLVTRRREMLHRTPARPPRGREQLPRPVRNTRKTECGPKQLLAPALVRPSLPALRMATCPG
jgi:hypothetical protein